MNFKVVDVIPDKRIVWLVTDCNLHWINDKKEWKQTVVVWEALPDNGATQVKMTHVGLVPGVQCFANCKEGWDFSVERACRNC